MTGWARGLYSALMTLGQPLMRRKLARRGQQEPGYLEAVDERFGHYRQPLEAASELVWVTQKLQPILRVIYTIDWRQIKLNKK